MAYVGRSPRYGFLEGQTATFDGSTTTVTLQRNVSSTDAIDVYIDNVHQEPDVAYTLSSGGNSITFTGTPENGAVLYIRFHGISFDTTRAYRLENSDGGSTATLGDDDSFTLSLDGTTALSATSSGVTIANLTVTGTTTTINSNDLNIGDNKITLNSDLPSDTAPTENAGIIVNRGSSSNVQFLWDETNDQWYAGNEIATGAKFHVRGSGSDPTYGGNTLAAFRNSGTDDSAYISIIGNSAQYSGIYFGDENDEDSAYLRLQHSNNVLYTNAPLNVNGSITGTGTATVNATNPVLILNDNDATTDVNMTGYVSLRRGGSEKGYIGFGSSTNNRLTIDSNVGDIDLTPTGNVDITTGNLQMGGNTVLTSTQNLSLSGQIDQTKDSSGSYINQFENENTGTLAYVETQWINSNSQLRVGTSRNYADPWQGAWVFADTQDLLIKAGGSGKAVKFFAGNVDDIRARITSTALHVGGNTDTYFDQVASGAVGVRLTTSGEIDVARSGAAPLNVNRLDSAGAIVNFKYNGDTVADINQAGTMSLDGSLHVGNNVTVAGDFNTDIVVKLSSYNTPAFTIQRYNNAALDLFAFGEMDGGTGTPWGGSSWGAAVIHTHNRNMVFSTAASDFADLVNGDAAIFIGYNDKVGIGMTTPSSTLEITADTNHATTEGAVVINNEMGNGYEALKLRSTGGLDANMSFRAEGTTSYWWGIGIDHSDSGSFKMGTDNLLGVNNRFKLTTGGNLSISGNMLADYYFLGVSNAWKIRPNNGNSEFCLEYDAATSSLSDNNIKFKVLNNGTVDQTNKSRITYGFGTALSQSYSGTPSYTPNSGDYIQLHNTADAASGEQYAAIWAETPQYTGTSGTTRAVRFGGKSVERNYSADFFVQTRGSNAQLRTRMTVGEEGVMRDYTGNTSSNYKWFTPVADDYQVREYDFGNRVYIKKDAGGSGNYNKAVFLNRYLPADFDMTFELKGGSPSSTYRHFAIIVNGDGGTANSNWDHVVLRQNSSNSNLNTIRWDNAGTSRNAVDGSSNPNFFDGTKRRVRIEKRYGSLRVEVASFASSPYTWGTYSSLTFTNQQGGYTGFSIYEPGATDTWVEISNLTITEV